MTESKVALITGANRGIGREILLSLATDGLTVVGTSRSAEGVAEIQKALSSVKGVGSGIVFDVTNKSAMTDLNEEIKQSDVKVSELSYDMDMRKVEIEKLEWALKDLKGKMDFDKGEIASIKGKLEGMNWEPTKLKDFINEPSFKIDENGHEGWLFKKLKKELIENNKLNYNYGKERDNE